MIDMYLSKRENEVLRLIARGMNNVDIAHELGISPNTVRNHVFDIYRVLEVHNRVQASLKYQELEKGKEDNATH